MTYKECKFYVKGGRCSHEDAPNPWHSLCIGRDECRAWDDGINYQSEKEIERTEGVGNAMF